MKQYVTFGQIPFYKRIEKLLPTYTYIVHYQAFTNMWSFTVPKVIFHAAKDNLLESKRPLIENHLENYI